MTEPEADGYLNGRQLYEEGKTLDRITLGREATVDEKRGWMDALNESVEKQIAERPDDEPVFIFGRGRVEPTASAPTAAPAGPARRSPRTVGKETAAVQEPLAAPAAAAERARASETQIIAIDRLAFMLDVPSTAHEVELYEDEAAKLIEDLNTQLDAKRAALPAQRLPQMPAKEAPR